MKDKIEISKNKLAVIIGGNIGVAGGLIWGIIKLIVLAGRYLQMTEDNAKNIDNLYKLLSQQGF